MSSETRPKKTLLEIIEELKVIPGGAEIIKGIYATPYTGIPFTLLVLASFETVAPGITNAFLSALGTFFAMVGQTAYNALLAISGGLNSQFNNPNNRPKVTAGTGNFCVQVGINGLVALTLELTGNSVGLVEGEQCFTDQTAAQNYYNTMINAKNKLGGLSGSVNVTKTGF